MQGGGCAKDWRENGRRTPHLHDAHMYVWRGGDLW